jgi:hypothetical protein
MQYALINGLPVTAKADGPTSARCLYCGEWVHFSTAPNITGPAWFHQSDEAAIVCRRERDRAQAELYEAIGVKL